MLCAGRQDDTHMPRPLLLIAKASKRRRRVALAATTRARTWPVASVTYLLTALDCR
jgi:hypothetical protein